MSFSTSRTSRVSATPEPSLGVLRYIDVVLVLVAAPILLLIGVPALGYLVGAGAWIALRAVGVVVERRAGAIGNVSQELTVRLVFVLGRVFLLALVIVLVRRQAGKQDGLATLLVILFAFTIQLVVSVINRPRAR
jgi:hypothetical protein